MIVGYKSIDARFGLGFASEFPKTLECDTGEGSADRPCCMKRHLRLVRQPVVNHPQRESRRKLRMCWDLCSRPEIMSFRRDDSTEQNSGDKFDVSNSPFMSFMEVALGEARRAGSRAEVPVGAVVVNSEGSILAAAGNRTREFRDPTAHAEILAIRAACRITGSERLTGSSLFVTLEPCAMCAGAISGARIARLYYGASDPKSGGVEHGARVFSHSQCHHRPEVYDGICEADCTELIGRFFLAKRS